MKAILLSIRPEWFIKILTGEKTIEVRKNKNLANAIKKLIDQFGKAIIYVCCSNTVNKNLIYFFNNDINLDTTIGEWEEHYQILTNKELKNITLSEDKNNICRKLNGKVVARFWCDETYDIIYGACALSSPRSHEWMCREVRVDLEEQSCLTQKQLSDYLGKCKKTPVAIHISKLEIFDRPRELGEFMKPHTAYDITKVSCKKKDAGKCNWGKSLKTGKWIGCNKFRLTKAPQNYCYVEGE